MLSAAAETNAGIFTKGTVGQLLFVVAYFAVIAILISRAKSGLKLPEIRKIPGLGAFEEAIGRATEMGKPIHLSTGGYAFSSDTLASFSILSHVARLTSQYDTRLIVTTMFPTNHPVLEETVRQAYMDTGRPDAFNSADVRYLSGNQYAYAAAVTGIFNREKVAANFMLGWYRAEALLIAEAGAMAGAIQIAGCPATYQLPYLVAVCDYALVGDELYAASAHLGRDPKMVGSLIGVDWFKMLIVAMIAIGVVFTNIGSKAFTAFITR
jgi:hypothetical protein